MPTDEELAWLNANEPPHTFPYCPKCGGPVAKSVHPTRHIEWGAMKACVDVEIADLVWACWNSGIVTTESCQDVDDDDTYMFLSFETIDDYARFAEQVMAGGPKDDVYRRIQGAQPSIVLRWDWSCYPADCSDEWEDPDGSIEPDMFCSVLIPVGDVPAAVRRLEAFATTTLVPPLDY